MERSGTSVAGQTKEAAVLRKGGNRKKRTTKELSIFFYCRSLYPCAHQGRRKKRRRREHRFPPRFLLGGLWVGCVVIYVFSFFTLCVLTCYRAYDGLRLRIESAMRGWMDGFQVRCSFMIAVEAAAGAVFLPIIKPKPWVRRDGLS